MPSSDSDRVVDTGNPRRNPVADEVERLSMRACTGESRYLGSSSGVEFAHIVQSIVDSANAREGLFAPVSNADELRNPPPEAVPEDAPIPSKEVAMPFIDAYFEHWHFAFPILHRPSFLQVAEHIYREQEYYQQNPFDAFIFDMVLAMGSTNRLEWSVTGTESHFARAMNKLDRILGMKGIMPLQALLFCCQYGVFASLRDTSTNMWHLLGIAARFCIELGLHRESSMSDPIHRVPGDTSVNLEIEMRRRCFWCFYNLDRVVSITLGRPFSIRDDDIDTALPSTLEDDFLDGDIGSSTLQDPGDTPSQISPFLQIIRLRCISGRIKQALYSIRLSKTLSMDEKFAIRADHRKELETWRSDVAKLNLQQRSRGNVPVSTFVSPSWYEVLFHNAMLLLYRPSPLLPHSGKRPTDMEPPDIEALQYLLGSAESTISGYTILLRNRRLNYSWITLYAVFMAGLAYVYSVGRAIRTRRWLVEEATVPRYIDVVNVTRNCSNTLVAICERWNDARSSCEIFDRLSTTAIQEAVKAETQGSRITSQSLLAQTPANQESTQYRLPPCDPSILGLNTLVSAATAEPTAEQYHPFADPSTMNATTAIGETTALQQTTADTPTHLSLSPDFFQNYFQDLQDAVVFNDDFSASNEVMLGFREEWFQRGFDDI